MHVSELEIGKKYYGDCGGIGITEVILRSIDTYTKVVQVEYSPKDIRTWTWDFLEYFMCQKIEIGDVDNTPVTLKSESAETSTSRTYTGVIKYITFTSSISFEEWQYQNNNPDKIISITPIMLNIGADMTTMRVEMSPAMGIFVTYRS